MKQQQFVKMMTDIAIESTPMSDEDEEITTKTILKRKGVVVEGEAPESDEELEDNRQSMTSSSSSSPNKSSSSSLFRSLFPMADLGSSSSSRRPSAPLTKYPGLLHRKLFDRNLELSKQLVDLTLMPHKTSLEELKSLKHSMLRTGSVLSESSASLVKMKDTMIRANILTDSLLGKEIGCHSVEPTVVAP